MKKKAQENKLKVLITRKKNCTISWSSVDAAVYVTQAAVTVYGKIIRIHANHDGEQ